MGRRNRERIERIRHGEEQSIAAQILSNPTVRRTVAVASKGAVLRELRNASTEEQIGVLGSISPSKVGRAIMKNAAKEIDEGIQTFLRQGRKVTVDGLLEEARNTPGFLDMCAGTGVSYKWFEELARERMVEHGIHEEEK